MKKYPGMRKLYYQLGGKRELAMKRAEELRESYSSITPGFSIGGYPSFIVYCDEMIDKLRNIRAICRSIDTLDGELPDVARNQFFRRAVIEEIQQSNETENVRSTRKEISDSMDAINRGRRGQRFDGMIRKYTLLLSKAEVPLESCQDVRKLYNEFILDEVLKEDPGNAPDGLYFRQGPVSIRNRHDTAIHEGVLPEAVINEAMERALAFLNDSNYDPLIRIAAFHFMFAYIHPFYDGNGRMARFISSAKLIENDVHSLVALRLSYVIKNRKNNYYALFKETNDRHNYGDMTLFVVGFLDFVLEACKQVYEFLTDKYEGIRHYFALLEGLDLSEETKRVLSVLVQVSVCESRSLNVSQLEQASGVSKYQIRNHLQEIESLCEVAEKGRSKLYRADLNALDHV